MLPLQRNFLLAKVEEDVSGGKCYDDSLYLQQGRITDARHTTTNAVRGSWVHHWGTHISARRHQDHLRWQTAM